MLSLLTFSLDLRTAEMLIIAPFPGLHSSVNVFIHPTNIYRAY